MGISLNMGTDTGASAQVVAHCMHGDNHVVELAVASGATHIVTWTTRDFSGMELRFPLLRVATPIEFLKEMTS